MAKSRRNKKVTVETEKEKILAKLQGKTIEVADLCYGEQELRLTFTDGSVLDIDSGEGHSVPLSEVTDEWVFEPLGLVYKPKEE